ncbi:MAG: xanthine dehydrogenase family protein subunit M [Actinobacteria bacterium]|nr:xanthine dehydrogenase family protein subunit M [Actinomycetota bacterium]
MFPSRFEYVAPRSLEEALSTLAGRGDEAKVLAGGQSLIPLLKLRFASPALIVDLNRVPGLSYLEESDGHLRIGALARNRDVVASQTLEAGYPTIAAAAPLVSDPIVRNLGTVAGSLAHADPAGDWGSVMLALGAEVTVRSASGDRTIPVADFLVDTFTTSLEPTEVITEIRVPKPEGSSGGTYLKLERKVGDFATVAVAVQLALDDGRIGRAGIALTAVGPKNIQAIDAERSLAGAEPTPESFQEAARLAADAASPISDVRGSADYKRAVVRTFVQRGLDRALELARAS